MKDYLYAQSGVLKLISFPDLKSVLEFPKDLIDDGSPNIGTIGNGMLLKSSYNHFKRIELVNREQNIGKFETVQEFEIINAVCCACSKISTLPTIAIGMADSSITINHYETQLEITKLKSKSKEDYTVFNCSKYLDFSSDNSQLLSVVEDGLIDVFDVRKKELTFKQQFKDDDVPTLAKFKPSNQPHFICVGFTSGKLKMFDTHAQKLVYKSNLKHFNLCKDLCFFDSKPNCVISVGYDSSVMIHDIRSSTTPSINFVSDHPLNSVAIPSDDNYYCIGDYKGNLKAYDMRKSNFTPLSTSKISNEIVKKMIFMQSNLLSFKDDSLVEVVGGNKTNQQIISNKVNTADHSSLNFDMTKMMNDEPSTSLKPAVVDELKCEKEFMKNIKSRSTCLFEQSPIEFKLSNEMPIGHQTSRSPTPIDDPNSSNNELSAMFNMINNFETQIKEMQSKIDYLKVEMYSMKNFVQEIPRFLEIEIQNLKQKYRVEDEKLVEKLSTMCASDPKIIELTNYMLNRHSKF